MFRPYLRGAFRESGHHRDANELDSSSQWNNYVQPRLDKRANDEKIRLSSGRVFRRSDGRPWDLRDRLCRVSSDTYCYLLRYHR